MRTAREGEDEGSGMWSMGFGNGREGASRAGEKLMGERDGICRKGKRFRACPSWKAM